MINRDRLVQTFLKLVQIDSPSGEEAEFREEMIRRFQNLGLTTEVDDYGNLIARLDEGDGAYFLFSGHMDTVEPGRGIRPVIRDGIIYSDGTTILGGDDNEKYSTRQRRRLSQRKNFVASKLGNFCKTGCLSRVSIV